jgi:hypothetical protein
MVQAVAGHSAVGERGKGARQLFFKIPADHWESIQTADTLWQTGDLKYTFKDYGATERITLRHYDVRFEPQGLHAIIANSRPTVNTESKAAPESEPAQKGPPVSDDHLKVWSCLHGGGGHRSDGAQIRTGHVPRKIRIAGQDSRIARQSSYGASQKTGFLTQVRDFSARFRDIICKKPCQINGRQNMQRITRDLSAKLDGDFSSLHSLQTKRRPLGPPWCRESEVAGHDGSKGQWGT